MLLLQTHSNPCVFTATACHDLMHHLLLNGTLVIKNRFNSSRSPLSVTVPLTFSLFSVVSVEPTVHLLFTYESTSLYVVIALLSFTSLQGLGLLCLIYISVSTGCTSFIALFPGSVSPIYDLSCLQHLYTC